MSIHQSHGRILSCGQCFEHCGPACPCRCHATALVANVTYFSYRHNRRISPHVPPERWASVYGDVEPLEELYQREGAVMADRYFVAVYDGHVIGARTTRRLFTHAVLYFPENGGAYANFFRSEEAAITTGLEWHPSIRSKQVVEVIETKRRYQVGEEWVDDEELRQTDVAYFADGDDDAWRDEDGAR
jgi:hypothetical protein